MFKIHIQNLAFQTIIGILPKERTALQKVVIDCEIEYLYEEKKFLDYAQICALIETLFQTNKYFLIEDALSDVCKNIAQNNSQIQTIRLKVMKPEILANADVGVEIFQKY